MDTMNDMLKKQSSGEFKGVYYTPSDTLSKEELSSQRELLDKLNNSNSIDGNIQELIDYNNNLLSDEPDQRFKSLVFTGGRILIRMFNRIPKQGSIITSNRIKIPKAKPGDFDEIENPFPYSDTGIVINIDPAIDYVSPGEIVQVEQNIITPGVLQGTSSLYIPAAYYLYNTNPTDKINYGYIMCYPRNIICKINKENFLPNS